MSRRWLGPFPAPKAITRALAMAEQPSRQGGELKAAERVVAQKASEESFAPAFARQSRRRRIHGRLNSTTAFPSDPQPPATADRSLGQDAATLERQMHTTTRRPWHGQSCLFCVTRKRGLRRRGLSPSSFRRSAIPAGTT